MDSAKTFELKVGIFMLIGIIILFIIVFSIGDINLAKEGYRIKVMFNFASGIINGAPVRLAGVGVGQVDAIRLIYDESESRTKAEITAWINNKDKVESDAIVTINTLGLLGEKYLEIYPGTPGKPLLKDKDTIVGKDPVPMEKVTENIAALSDSAKAVMENLKEGRGTIGKLLTDETIYKDLEAFAEDIKKHPWKLLSKPRGED